MFSLKALRAPSGLVKVSHHRRNASSFTVLFLRLLKPENGVGSADGWDLMAWKAVDSEQPCNIGGKAAGITPHFCEQALPLQNWFHTTPEKAKAKGTSSSPLSDKLSSLFMVLESICCNVVETVTVLTLYIIQASSHFYDWDQNNIGSVYSDSFHDSHQPSWSCKLLMRRDSEMLKDTAIL